MHQLSIDFTNSTNLLFICISKRGEVKCALALYTRDDVGFCFINNSFFNKTEENGEKIEQDGDQEMTKLNHLTAIQLNWKFFNC